MASHGLAPALALLLAPGLVLAESGRCPDGSGWLSPASVPMPSYRLLDEAPKFAFPGTPAEYTAFNGQTHLLTVFEGAHTALLLPPQWLAPVGMDEDEIRNLLELADLAYLHFSDLLGAEPQGDGKLTMAVVPETCGVGCALLGRKAQEYRASPTFLQQVRAQLAQGALHSTIIHEFAHNFDLFHPYLAFWNEDPVHAFTSFADRYLEVFARSGRPRLDPDELLEGFVRQFHWRYVNETGASFETCMLGDQPCEGLEALNRNRIWAGLWFRFAALHGPAAVRRAMGSLLEQLGQTRAKREPPADTVAERNDRTLRAMAAGAGLNIGCYLETWKWQASAELLAELEATWGTYNPFCEDADGDGFSPVQGDCDDADPAVAPGASEVVDGRDTSCSGFVDDVLRGGNLALQSDLGVPGRFQDSLSASVVAGPLTLPPGERLLFNLCAEGGAMTIDLEGSAGSASTRLAREGDCVLEGLTPAPGESLQLTLTAQDGQPEYRLTLITTPAWPRSFAEPFPPADAGGSAQLRTRVASLTDALGAPDELRHFVAGLGWVAASPFAFDSAVGLPQGLAMGARSAYRSQAYFQGVPVTGPSARARFRVGQLAPVMARALWYDRSRNGHGFDFQRVSGDTWFLVFYTYEADGTPTWYAAAGTLQDGQFQADSNGLAYITYDSARQPPQQVDPTRSGSVGLDFRPEALASACDDGVERGDAYQLAAFTWQLDGEAGLWCVEPIQIAAGRPLPDASGQWFAGAADDGWGLMLHHAGLGQVAALVAFVYDSQGLPRWSLGVSEAFSLAGGEVPMHRFQGYCRTCAPVALISSPAGTVRWLLTQPASVPDAGNQAEVDLHLGAGLGSWQRPFVQVQLLGEPAAPWLP
jgi:hypothetical protein